MPGLYEEGILELICGDKSEPVEFKRALRIKAQKGY